MDIYEIRKENFREIVKPDTRGNVAKFARDNDIDPGYIRQMFADIRPIGEKSARTLEAKCGLPYMSLDIRGGITMPNADSDKVAAAIMADQELTLDYKKTLLQMLATYRSIQLMKISIDHADTPELTTKAPGKSKQK
jgi:hypothetical protein